MRTATNAYLPETVRMAIVRDRLSVCVRRTGVGRIAPSLRVNRDVVSRILVKTMASASTLPWATIVVNANEASLDVIVVRRVGCPD